MLNGECFEKLKRSFITGSVLLMITVLVKVNVNISEANTGKCFLGVQLLNLKPYRNCTEVTQMPESSFKLKSSSLLSSLKINKYIKKIILESLRSPALKYKYFCEFCVLF